MKGIVPNVRRKNPYAAVASAIRVFEKAEAGLDAAVAALEDEKEGFEAEIAYEKERFEAQIADLTALTAKAEAERARAVGIRTKIAALIS